MGGRRTVRGARGNELQQSSPLGSWISLSLFRDVRRGGREGGSYMGWHHGKRKEREIGIQDIQMLRERSLNLIASPEPI